MGGGGQANSGQATTAANQQTAANTQDMAISAANAKRQQQLTNTLFGTGAPGSTGTLSGMLDPSKLNQTGLNDNYKTQFNEGSNTLGQDYANQRGSLAQQFANSGATSGSTPSGFQADQMRKLGSSEADSRGAMYSGLKGQQYNDTLNNFWNANNIASGNAGTAGQTATQSAGNSGTSSAGIYGTAGQYHPSAMGNVVGSALGAAGAVGQGAMTCPADGGLILMADNTVRKIEDVHIGDLILGIDLLPDEVIDIQPTLQNCCTIITPSRQTIVSDSHTFERHHGGYTFARKSEGEEIAFVGGPERVINVIPLAEKKMCRHIMLKRSHGYCCDGFWSLE